MHTSPYLRLLIVKMKVRLLVITGEVFAVSNDTFNTKRLSWPLQMVLTTCLLTGELENLWNEQTKLWAELGMCMYD